MQKNQNKKSRLSQLYCEWLRSSIFLAFLFRSRSRSACSFVNLYRKEWEKWLLWQSSAGEVRQGPNIWVGQFASDALTSGFPIEGCFLSVVTASDQSLSSGDKQMRKLLKPNALDSCLAFLSVTGRCRFCAAQLMWLDLDVDQSDGEGKRETAAMRWNAFLQLHTFHQN